GRDLDATRVAVAGDDLQRVLRWQRTHAADDGVGCVVRGRPEVVPGRGELVAGGALPEVERVPHHRVDVGVLDQQRAAPGPVELVSEAPHAVVVGVGDRADRRQPEIAAREPDGEGGARPQRLRRGGEGGGGRGDGAGGGGGA